MELLRDKRGFIDHGAMEMWNYLDGKRDASRTPGNREGPMWPSQGGYDIGINAYRPMPPVKIIKFPK